MLMTVSQLMERIEKQGLKANDEVGFICSNAPPTVTWLPEDILELRPNWTPEQAEMWLDNNSRVIQERMCETGWSYIELLLPDMEGDVS